MSTEHTIPPARNSPAAPLTFKEQGAGQEFPDSKLFAETVFNSVHDAISVIDATDFKIVKANKAFLTIAGLEENDVIGRPCYEITHHVSKPCEGPLDLCPLAETLKTGGVSAAEHVHYDREGREIYVEVSTSPLRSGDAGTRYIIHTAHNITKLKQAEEELRRTLYQLKRVLNGTIEAIAKAVQVRDPYTAGHEQRVSQLACAIGKTLGFDVERLECLHTAGLLHDLGKIAVPSEILSRPGRLSDHQFNLIKDHCQVGFDILRAIEFPWPVAEIVLQHHEHMDGSGYPGGLSGEVILLEARILAVADVVEAIASHRPYRPGLGVEAAMKQMSQNRGTLYDASVVDACLAVFAEGLAFE
ncbi:MAG: HD domain-containing protein [Chloroflexi bacterium]|nr:HD domain-containing protein [Chloroflexota bacterium]